MNKTISKYVLLLSDCTVFEENTTWCPKILVRDIKGSLLGVLGGLLDPPHPLGTHWCMLAVSLGNFFYYKTTK